MDARHARPRQHRLENPRSPARGRDERTGPDLHAAARKSLPAGHGQAKWLRQHTNIIFVDFHAEATLEKIAFARMLDGQVSAVVGTHTHVQTADEQIFPGGTAYLTDAGFTGPHESALQTGEIQPVLQRFRTAMPQRFEVARNDIKLHGAVIEIDDVTGKATKIQRVAESLPA